MKEQVFTVRIKSDKKFSKDDIKSALYCSVNIRLNVEEITVTPAQSTAEEFVKWVNNRTSTKFCTAFGDSCVHCRGGLNSELKLFQERVR